MFNEDTTQPLESSILDVLEKKKKEIIATSGSVYALKELATTHQQHIDKIRRELQDSVAAGKMTQEVGNFVLAQVARSAKVIDDCRDSFKARYDIKTGEALAYKSILDMMSSEPEEPAEEPKDKTVEDVLDRDAVAQVSTQLSEQVEAAPKSSPSARKKKSETSKSDQDDKSSERTRPDQRGKIAETVERLKKTRKKNQPA